MKKTIEHKLYDLIKDQKELTKRSYKGKELAETDIIEVINSLLIRNKIVNKSIGMFLNKGKLPKGIELKSFRTNLEFEYIYIIELMLRLNTDIFGVQNILDSYKMFISIIETTKQPEMEGSTIENITVLVDADRLQTISRIK